MAVLHVGNLAWSCTDEDLKNLFESSCGEGSIVSATVERYEDTGRSKGFGLVTFASNDVATANIDALNGLELNGRAIFVKPDRYDGQKKPTPAAGSSVYVSNLAWSCTDDQLYSEFVALVGADSIESAKVMRHADSGRSKGWGFVNCTSPEAANAAIGAANGIVIVDRAIEARLDHGSGFGGSRPPRNGGFQQGGGQMYQGGGGGYGGGAAAGSSSVVYVGNLSWQCTDDELYQLFSSACGSSNVLSAEVSCHADSGRSKGWGLVTCATPDAANLAIQSAQGLVDSGGRSIFARLDRNKF